MRIVLIGQGAFGEKTLEALAGAGEQVAGVFCPPDPPAKPGPLRVAAERLGIPAYQPRHMREPWVQEAMRGLQPDLGVMAFVTDIVPLRLLRLPTLGTIQYHPSLLPRHRGASAINWAVIQGETRTGLTIFWPDSGVDTGPVLLQRAVDIGPDDTTGSLYFGKLFPLGIEALVESVREVREGTAPRMAQDESQATYEPPCSDSLTVIDWSRPVGEVYNLIRGANPSPGAVTSFHGRRLKLYDTSRVYAADCAAPGSIVAAGPEGIVIAALGGALAVRRLAWEGAGKMPAGDAVAAGQFNTGDILGA